MQAPFNLTILGSSAAVPTSNKFPSAQILNVFGRLFLIDCGEGTQHQLRANKINMARIDHILISHLHGDHFFGLIGLLSTLSLLGRRTDLHIYAHSEIKTYIDFHFAFLKQNDLGYNIIYHPLSFKSPQVIFENKRLTINSFPLKHSIPCCGFRFDEKQKEPNIRKDKLSLYDIPIKEIKNIKAGADFITAEGKCIPNEKLIIQPPAPRSYAYCSDTMYHEAIIPQVQDVSLLYHETTFLDQDKALAQKTTHSTALDAAKIAKQANAAKLIIGHISARYKCKELLVNEAQSCFKHTCLAKENSTIEL